MDVGDISLLMSIPVLLLNLSRKIRDKNMRLTPRLSFLTISFSLCADVNAQLGARVASDYDAGGFRSGGDFFLVLISALLMFIVPGVIAAKDESAGDGPAFTYFKCFFTFIAAWFVLFIFIPREHLSYFGLLLLNLAVAAYLLVKKRGPVPAIEGRIADSPRMPPKAADFASIRQARDSVHPWRWAVLGARVYDKVTHDLYRYELVPEGSSLNVLDATGAVLLTIEAAEIDIVKFHKGLAKVRCPRCSERYEVLVATWVQMRCTNCGSVWQQHLKMYSDFLETNRAS